MTYPKQLLIFDWDGTLMDSQARIVSCFSAAIQDMNMELRSPAQISNIIGLGFKEALHALYPEQGDEYHADFVDCYRHYFLGDDQTPSVLFEGTLEMLESLNSQDYFIAIATGKGRHGLDLALSQHNVQHLFHASRCADETRSKPHPQMVEELMDYFGVESEQALMIGDTEYDLQMANNAKIQSVAVTYGVHDKQRLLEHQPIACIDTPAALHTWLQESITNEQSNFNGNSL